MRGDPRKTNFEFHDCPGCGSKLLLKAFLTCENCKGQKILLQCEACEFRKKICTCESGNKQNLSTNNFCVLRLCLIVALVGIFIYCFYHPSSSGTANIMNNLRKKYPLQKNETWYNFLSVLEHEVPSVKSIIFLHGKDKRTSDCLAKELVNLFSSNKIINFEDIHFSNLGYDAKDYGLVLEHYRPIVKRFKVFITDLTLVTGNVARIFHSLCDEVSSDIKPSLFIFTLKYEERMKNLKPYDRALAILKEAWHDLPQSQMYPLLSRVVKIVIDVVPEKQVSC